MLQPRDHLGGPPLDSLQYVLVCVAPGSPELDTALPRHAHTRWTRGSNHFPQPVGYTLAETAQSAVHVPYHRGTLLNWVQLVVCENHLPLRRSFSEKLLRKKPPSPPALLYGVIPSQKQVAAFAFVDLHEVPVSPFLMQVKVHLNKLSDLQVPATCFNKYF